MSRFTINCAGGAPGSGLTSTAGFAFFTFDGEREADESAGLPLFTPKVDARVEPDAPATDCAFVSRASWGRSPAFAGGGLFTGLLADGCDPASCDPASRDPASCEASAARGAVSLAGADGEPLAFEPIVFARTLPNCEVVGELAPGSGGGVSAPVFAGGSTGRSARVVTSIADIVELFPPTSKHRRRAPHDRALRPFRPLRRL